MPNPAVELLGFRLVGTLDELEEAGPGDDSHVAAGDAKSLSTLDAPLIRVELQDVG